MKLYKYRCDTSRDIKTLVENRLFVPDKNLLNDPTEMCVDDTELLAFLEKYKNLSLEVKRIYQELKDFTRTKCGIFSLSKDVKNELLWAYYANGHKGLCIEYDSEKIMESYNYGVSFKNKNPESFPLVHRIDVKYSDSYPVLKPEYLNVKDNMVQILKCLVGTKSKRWIQEDEVRLIFNKHGYTELDYRAVTGIYYGVNFNDSDKDAIMNKLQGRGIKYYQMRFEKNSYQMGFDEIKDNYLSAPKFVANDLSYDNISWLSSPEENAKYLDLVIQALEFVSKEPCINKITSCYVNSTPEPMVAIQTLTNEDFKTFPIKTYRFDIVTKTNQIRLRKFQL
ncbi:MAG: DUF2971 domain-containing protein [Bacteroidota bacterium]|nr:DUF2971 domain-containing protein [Bacteroidota bacterium]